MIERSRQSDGHLCTTRREFLLTAGSATVVVLLAPDLLHADAGAALQVASYPRKRVGSMSELRNDTPVGFSYPFEASPCFMVKLGVPAGGGAGPDRDIVAFSSVCTHMGGPLTGQYQATVKIVGPCPFHLTTFDLTRHGMVVAGHATESLPQVRLEAVNDDLYATGIMGLLYGHHDNLAGQRA